MSTKDIFYAVVIGSLIFGIICLLLSDSMLIALSYTTPAFANIQQQLGITNFPAVQAANSLGTFAQQFLLFFPDLAVLCCLVLIISSFIMSYYIKASPLAAVFGIFMLFLYLVATYYISGLAIQIAHLAIFQGLLPSSNLLLLWFINMPTILIICTCIDIAIAVTSAVKS